uniref:Uncharacterized protein n=1 Tax=Setaria italica TaxID=4555 RepID=K3ZFZ0_SETIT
MSAISSLPGGTGAGEFSRQPAASRFKQRHDNALSSNH